jgi:hypothetical protein
MHNKNNSTDDLTEIVIEQTPTITDEQINAIIQIFEKSNNIKILNDLIKNPIKTDNDTLKDFIKKIKELQQTKGFTLKNHDSKIVNAIASLCYDFKEATSTKEKIIDYAPWTCNIIYAILNFVGTTGVSVGSIITSIFGAKFLTSQYDLYCSDYNPSSNQSLLCKLLPLGIAVSSGVCGKVVIPTTIFCAGILSSLCYIRRPIDGNYTRVYIDRESKLQNLKNQISSLISNHWNSADKYLQFLQEVTDKQNEILKLIKEISVRLQSDDAYKNRTNIHIMFDKYDNVSFIDLDELSNDLAKLKKQLADENSLLLEKQDPFKPSIN